MELHHGALGSRPATGSPLYSAKPSGQRALKILVSGGSGFIGSRLVGRLAASTGHEIICMTRNPESLAGRFGGEKVRVVRADVMNYGELVRCMKGVHVAFYLVHSMEGVNWKKFAQRDRRAAENFARAATECGVGRIIYLGGLSHGRDEELSEHMLSRRQVGEILKTSSARVTILCAAVILGPEGGSFQMLRYLVERLPVMVCPKWVLTKSQPIAVDDVIAYLVGCIGAPETEGREFDIGGPDVLTYVDMMKIYAQATGRPTTRVMIIPFLTPRLSSYWVDLVTPVRASLARPLIDSLRHEATVRDNSIQRIIPFRLKTFEEAVRAANAGKLATPEALREGRASRSLNNRLLIASLLAMAATGSTYYWLDARPEILQAGWLALGALWYLAIAFSVYFLRYGTKLGTLVAGILGWVTLAFWLADNYYLVSGNPFFTASSPDVAMTVRNFVGIIVAGLIVATSHNVFYKSRL